jgi:nitrite reductase (NADH) large subunit
MNATRYLIIGNGVAGITAAEKIREVDENGEIVIIGDEGEPYYYRASLSEWISGDNTEAMVYARTPAFYEEMNLNLVDGLVTEVMPDDKLVRLEDGETRPYDKLLIATGARANSFPIEGLDEDEILVYRTWDHARQIKDAVAEGARVLILGGGILGLELAGALVQMGVEEIAVVQLLDFMGGPVLDQPAGEWLHKRMRADGVDLFLNDTVERVEGETAHFKSGKTWDFDLFVESVGIRQRYPEVPDLKTGRGIQIDAYARTNHPDIYAAGDCTETYDPDTDAWQSTRIWLDCARQGKVAACNMTGIDDNLRRYPFFNASIIYDVHYAYLGDPHGEDGEVFLWTKGEHAYRKVRMVEGKLAGALLLGNRYGLMPLYKAIGQPVADFGESIVQPDFAWNELTGKDWDYVFF